jgi:Zn-dependent hydrolases, including glyoxylases
VKRIWPSWRVRGSRAFSLLTATIRARRTRFVHAPAHGRRFHPADAPHARKEGAELDDELNPGDKAGPFVVIDSPGKSLGEVVLHWPERRILLVGDAVVGDPPGRCKLLPDKVVDDPPRLRDSARGLLALDFDILLVGDGVPILQSAKERLRELVDTF